MKYSLIDSLDKFDFHDSQLSLISWDDDLVLSAKLLNVDKSASGCDTEVDLEIDEARITFFGFKLDELEVGRSGWQRDENGEFYTDEPRVVYTGDDARSRFRNMLFAGIDVYSHSLISDDGGYEIFANGDIPFFLVRFNFDSVKIEWDAYVGFAWYEKSKSYKTHLTLSTAEGNGIHDAFISLYYADNLPELRLGEPERVSIGVKYGNMEYWGSGVDPYLTDALVELENKLPTGVEICCCLNCRHGNMCPVGNKIGEVFCTSDVVIKERSDLYFYTEDDHERETRSRTAFDICERYEAQSPDYYTYSDYYCARFPDLLK